MRPCLLCRFLGCNLQITPGIHVYDLTHRPGDVEGEPTGRLVDPKPVRACSRCWHFEGSLVCGGRRAPLQRPWTRLWAVLATLCVTAELVALRLNAPGDTLSEQVWTFAPTLWGLPVFLLLGWLLFHFSFGRDRKPGRWWDAAGLALGALFWLFAILFG